jgi:hypothetical protein
MKKELVTFDQLTAGALLKFRRLDGVDMTLLMGELNDKYELVHDKCDIGNNYFLLCNGNILLNEDYILKYWGSVDDKVLERIQGKVIKEYMDNLDMHMFTLRKVRLFGLGCIVKENLSDNFCREQLKCIDRLYEKGFIEDYIQEDVRYGDYEAVRITQEGKLQLFKIDNKVVLEHFSDVVRFNGLDISLCDEFLLEQDLDENCYEILTLNNYNEFCLNRYEKSKSYRYVKN